MQDDHAYQPPARRYRRKPRTCPECGSRRVASILYGLPAMTPELEQALADGRIVLGGCCVCDDDAAWACADCGAKLYPAQDGERIA